jgi:hypothetical protein
MEALVEPNRSGELVNPEDKKGYRLKEWKRVGQTPILFA